MRGVTSKWKRTALQVWVYFSKSWIESRKVNEYKICAKIFTLSLHVCSKIRTRKFVCYLNFECVIVLQMISLVVTFVIILMQFQISEMSMKEPRQPTCGLNVTVRNQTAIIQRFNQPGNSLKRWKSINSGHDPRPDNHNINMRSTFVLLSLLYVMDLEKVLAATPMVGSTSFNILTSLSFWDSPNWGSPFQLGAIHPRVV
jgi:hypothetical protein